MSAPVTLYQATDAARLLGVSPAYVSQLMAAGKLTASGKIGLDPGRPAFTAADLRAAAPRFGREVFIDVAIAEEAKQ